MFKRIISHITVHDCLINRLTYDYQKFRWYFSIQIIINLWWFIIYKHNFVCLSLAFIREIIIYILFVDKLQAYYLTQRFLFTGQPSVRIRSFTTIQYTLFAKNLSTQLTGSRWKASRTLAARWKSPGLKPKLT